MLWKWLLLSEVLQFKAEQILEWLLPVSYKEFLFHLE